MLTRRENESKYNRQEITYISLEEMVPADHLVRKIDGVMDWKWIYKKVENLYSENTGRPSVDPIILVKISMLQLIFGIDSMRQTISEIQTNMAYRWFLGYSLHDSIPHHSTVGKNFIHRFRENEVAEDIFAYVLEQCINSGLVENHTYFIDSTHVKASANKHKLEEKEVSIPPKAYQAVLKESIEETRKNHGKKPLKKKKKSKKRKQKR
jgi:transposase